jgi:hypothetical protein
MKVRFTIIIMATIMFSLVMGCSSKISEHQVPVNNQSSGGIIPSNDEDVQRGCTWRYPGQQAFSFMENGIGDYNSTLIDCIAATRYETDTGDKGNYLLVCDQQGTWDSSSAARLKVFFIPWDADARNDVVEVAFISDTEVIDPDACDLIAIKVGLIWKLYAFIYDGYDSIISHYEWTITPSTGVLTSVGWVTDDIIDCGDNAHASGIAVTPVEDDRYYHIFVCDPQEKKVYVHPYSWNNGWEYIEDEVMVLDDISPNTPIDVAITRYDHDDEHHTAYIAVESSVNRLEDYIYCYHFDGTDYSENDQATNLYTQGSDYFPYIVAIDVMKVGVDSDVDFPSVQHYSGNVVVYMVDTDLLRSYCFCQADFYGVYNGDSWYQFDRVYDCEGSSGGGEILPETIGVAEYNNGSGIKGQSIFVASRNPDLESGYDIRVYYARFN